MRKLLQRFSRAFAWRKKLLRERSQQRFIGLSLTLRWNFSGNGREHSLSAPLIVSLTSHRARFGTLAWALRGLLRQTVRADQTILWIGHDDMPFLPHEVLAMQQKGLTIRATDDIRCFTKIIPALQSFPGAFICTADDDLYYHATWLEELLQWTAAAGPVVTCHRAHQITLSPEGAYRPYTDWVQDIPFRGQTNGLFPTGVSGVLYPPGILAHTPADIDAIYNLCPFGDDIWLYWIARRNGVTYQTVGKHRKLITIEGSQVVTLWHANIGDGRNDDMIANMAEVYGYPSLVNADRASYSRHPSVPA